MDLQSILADLKTERDRLHQAIAALEGTGAPGRRRGPVPGTRRRGGLTPAGRRRLSEMMKKRWAERRRSSAGRAKRRSRLTPEGRRRLSEMMKKRWAERRRKGA